MGNYVPLTSKQTHLISSVFYEAQKRETLERAEPRHILVGGQPGAGKTAAAHLGQAELNEQGGFIHVDPDKMRKLIDRDGKPTPEQTQGDSKNLANALRDLAKSDKRNILEEGTLRSPDKVCQLIDSERAKGYKVEILAVATAREESLLGIYQRFEMQHEAGDYNPRFVPEKYHDDAMRSFETTLVRAASSLDRVRIVDRAGQVLFDSRSNQQGNALEALAEGRRLTDKKLSEVTKSWAAVEEAALRRGAPATYLDAVRGHQQRLEDMQKERIHAHAMKHLDSNARTLARDERYNQHTNGELAKAAYFRGFHEKASEFKGIAPDFVKYDATAANRQTLKQLPNVADLAEKTISRDRSHDSHSL